MSSEEVQDARPVSAVIDERDRSVSVNSGWSEVAQANDAEHLDSRTLIGKPIWDFIVDVDTTRIYEVLLGEVRRKKSELAFPFRCDSPDMLRQMEMRLKACGQGGVEFQSRTLRTEPRDRRAFFKYAAFAAKGIFLRCSFCNLVQFEGQWTDVCSAAEHLLDRDIPIQVCYAICGQCDAALKSRFPATSQYDEE